MQPLLTAAAVLAISVGVVHSFLGERLIFRHLHQPSFVSFLPALPLRRRNVQILRENWHIASVFGWVIAGLLWQLAKNPGVGSSTSPALDALAAGLLASALLALVGTRGRHPGWVAFRAAGVCLGRLSMRLNNSVKPTPLLGAAYFRL